MSKYIEADKLEKDGWNIQRIRQVSSTEMVCETKKPTDFPAADVQEVVKEWCDERNCVIVAREDFPRLEVRHGHWVKVDDNPYEYVAMCSVCRNEVKQPTCMLKPIYSYCPICGAKMDEVEE